MLKLTNSFYRYYTVTCERLGLNNTHVRKLAHLSCRKERCCLDCVDLEAKRQFHRTLSLRKHSKKTRPRIKIPPLNSYELDQTELMSESVQPTGNHVSFGGKFDVSSGDKPEMAAKCERDDPNYPSPNASLPPPFRVWEAVVKERNNGSDGTFRFKVVSYNVLAQYLLESHSYLYTSCNPNNLKWKVRAERLYNEIISLEPDILCLQEVQVSHLKNFYSKFEESGYSVIFKQKTGTRQDGCAIYFKSALFELLDHICVEFYQPELPILNRDQIGVLVKLAPKGPVPAIVVATTHLLYNPKRTDVRLAQLQVLLAEIDRFAFYSNERGSGYLPIILTGDFNSIPESAVVTLLDQGHVSAKHFRDSSDWEKVGVMDNCQHLAVHLNRQLGIKTDFNNLKIANSEYGAGGASTPGSGKRSHYPLERTPFSNCFNSGHLSHSLRLISTYDKCKPDGSREASSFQDGWVTVDYIYFSCCSNLRLKSRLRLPTASECVALKRLPNEQCPSDHLVLAAVFELIDPGRTFQYVSLCPEFPPNARGNSA